MPPQSNSAVVDDEYGLEPAKPAAAGVTDDKYGLEPAGKSGTPKTEAERLGVTPAKGTPPMKPQTETQFEKQHSGGGVINALKSMLPEDPTEGRSPLDLKFWLNTDKSKFDPTGPGSAYNDVVRPLPGQPGADATPLPGVTGSSGSALGRGVYRAASVVGGGAGVNAEGMESASGKGDTSGVATQAAVPLVMMAAHPIIKKMGPIVSDASNKVSSTIANAARDATTGELKPSVATTGKVLGAIGGGVTGALAGEGLVGGAPGQHGGGLYGGITGARAGYSLGPTVLDKMIPPRAVYPGAPLPAYEDFAQNHAEDLAKRGKEQARIDKTNEGKLKEAEETRQRDLADRGKLEMQDATEQSAAIRRQRAEETKTAATGGPKNSPVLPGGKIVGPEADPLNVKTTYQSYDRPKLVEMARKGDRNAFEELVRNPAGTDLTQFKYQYGYGAPGKPVYQSTPFRNYDYKGNLEAPKRPLLLGKAPVPAGAPESASTAPLNFEQTIKVPSEAPIAPMKPPVAENVPRETIQPMEKLVGETPEGGEPEMERLRRNPPMPTREMSEAEKRAAEVKPKARTSPSEVGKPMQPRFNFDELTPAQRQKAVSSGVYKGQKLTPQELEALKK